LRGKSGPNRAERRKTAGMGFDVHEGE